MSLNNGHIRLSAATFDIIKFVQDILSASSNNISNEKLQIGSSTMGALTIKKRHVLLFQLWISSLKRTGAEP